MVAGWNENFERCTFHLTQSYVFSMYWLFCSLCLPLKIICLPSSRQMIFIYFILWSYIHTHIIFLYIYTIYIVSYYTQYMHPLYTTASGDDDDNDNEARPTTGKPKPSWWWWVWHGIHPNPHRPELFLFVALQVRAGCLNRVLHILHIYADGNQGGCFCGVGMIVLLWK